MNIYFTSYVTTKKIHIIHLNEKEHGQCKASSFHILLSALGRQLLAVLLKKKTVDKEWPGIDGGNNTYIKHVKTTV